jgi:hypothetical protein
MVHSPMMLHLRITPGREQPVTALNTVTAEAGLAQLL